MNDQGRSFHSDGASAYPLPNDSPEQDRLAAQARYLSAVMDHKVLHAPLDTRRSDLRLLDMGCGTGYVTEAFGAQFPQAQVFGVDLSPVPKRPRAENVRFLQGNILSQPPTAWVPEDEGEGDLELTRDEDVFDHIFSRLIISGMNDWDAFVRKEFELLRSGGWAEIHELDGKIYLADGSNITDSSRWHSASEKAALKHGIDFSAGRRAAERMKQAGFIDISVRDYPMPIGGEGERTAELQAAGEFWSAISPEIFNFVYKKYLDPTPEEQEEMWEELLRNFAPAPGKHFKMVVTLGRKPWV